MTWVNISALWAFRPGEGVRVLRSSRQLHDGGSTRPRPLGEAMNAIEGMQGMQTPIWIEMNKLNELNLFLMIVDWLMIHGGWEAHSLVSDSFVQNINRSIGLFLFLEHWLTPVSGWFRVRVPECGWWMLFPYCRFKSPTLRLSKHRSCLSSASFFAPVFIHPCQECEWKNMEELSVCWYVSYKLLPQRATITIL